MSLFWHFFKGFSRFFKARIWIRIRIYIGVKIRLRIPPPPPHLIKIQNLDPHPDPHQGDKSNPGLHQSDADQQHCVEPWVTSFFHTLSAVKREPVNDAGLCNTGVGKNFFIYFPVIRYQVLLWVLTVWGSVTFGTLSNGSGCGSGRPKNIRIL